MLSLTLFNETGMKREHTGQLEGRKETTKAQ